MGKSERTESDQRPCWIFVISFALANPAPGIIRHAE
jgi:hypothetical protein